MPISISTHFAFELDQQTDVLLQFEAAALPYQRLITNETLLGQSDHVARTPAQDGIGERIWIRTKGRFEARYRAEVDLSRKNSEVAQLEGLPPHLLPGETVPYLLDSRYCTADRFQPFVNAEFGGTTGGARIKAIHDWIAQKFEYVPGASNAETGAVDSFISRQGICRDYSHVLVTLARASGIPARYVACYAPRVNPQDFHAVAEVFLADPDVPEGGAWQMVDATGMADPEQTVTIGVGRDAADVSFITSFGPNRFVSCTVDVSKS